MRERAPKKQSEAATWIVKFLNLNFSSDRMTDRKGISDFLGSGISPPDRTNARVLHSRFTRRLLPFAESPNLAELVEQERTDADARIADLKEEIYRHTQGANNASRKQAAKNIQEDLHDAAQFRAELEQYSELSEKGLTAKRSQLAQLLPAANLITPIDALQRVLQDLNSWASSTKITHHWLLSPSTTPLRQGQRVFKIGKRRYVIEHWPTVSGFENLAYLMIAKCVESGELFNLKRCGFCRQFFIADRQGKGYCKPSHQREHDRIAARRRAKKWRSDNPP